MDAVKFLKEDERMCHTIADCVTCPLSENNNKIRQCCSIFKQEHPKEYVEIVEQWSKEHPQKTIFDDFKEKYPNALLDDGIPIFCPYMLGYNKEEKPCLGRSCKECWNTSLEDVK